VEHAAPRRSSAHSGQAEAAEPQPSGVPPLGGNPGAGQAFTSQRELTRSRGVGTLVACPDRSRHAVPGATAHLQLSLGSCGSEPFQTPSWLMMPSTLCLLDYAGE